MFTRKVPRKIHKQRLFFIILYTFYQQQPHGTLLLDQLDALCTLKILYLHTPALPTNNNNNVPMIPKVGIDQHHYYFDNKTSSPLPSASWHIAQPTHALALRGVKFAMAWSNLSKNAANLGGGQLMRREGTRGRALEGLIFRLYLS